MSLNTNINLRFAAQLTSALGVSVSNIGTPTALTNGTNAYQADLVYAASRSVTSGTPDTMDLNGGGLLQPNGTAFNAVEVVGVVILNTSTTGTLTLGGGSNALANFSAVVKPLGQMDIFTPANPAWTVMPSTGDILQVVADTGTVAYQILILGRSA